MLSGADLPQGPLRILLIEDNPGDAGLVRAMLAESLGARFIVEWVQSLQTGRARLGLGEAPDLARGRIDGYLPRSEHEPPGDDRLRIRPDGLGRRGAHNVYFLGHGTILPSSEWGGPTNATRYEHVR